MNLVVDVPVNTILVGRNDPESVCVDRWQPDYEAVVPNNNPPCLEDRIPFRSVTEHGSCNALLIEHTICWLNNNK